jgi:hypothetical protein
VADGTRCSVAEVVVETGLREDFALFVEATGVAVRVFRTFFSTAGGDFGATFASVARALAAGFAVFFADVLVACFVKVAVVARLVFFVVNL